MTHSTLQMALGLAGLLAGLPAGRPAWPGRKAYQRHPRVREPGIVTWTGIGLNQGVGLIRATSGDTDLLTDSEIRTFTECRPRGDQRSGPAGHRSRAWHQKMIANTYFYKITLNGEVVGGLIVARLGWHHFHLVRIWVDPAHQDRGVGTRALALLEAARRHVTLWTVDAPAWARRRRRFYEANGYRAACERDGSVHYEKRCRGVLRLPPSLAGSTFPWSGPQL